MQRQYRIQQHIDENSSRGEVVDAGGLTESGINAIGTMAILNIGCFVTFVSRVDKHIPGTHNFFYNDTFGDMAQGQLILLVNGIMIPTQECYT